MPNEVVAGLQLQIDANTIAARQQIDALKQTVHGASRQMKTDMMETRVAIKLMGEELGINLNRHLVSFISKLPGTGVFAAAFPVAAVVGIGVAFFEAGKKLYEFWEKTRSVAGEIGDSMKKLTQSTEASNNELSLGNAKLSEQIAKLEHKPVNALATALAEARVEADKLSMAMAHSIDEMSKLFKEKSVGLLGGLMTGEAPTKHAQEAIQEQLRAIAAVDDRERERLKNAKSDDEAEAIRQDSQISRQNAIKNAINITTTAWNNLRDAQRYGLDTILDAGTTAKMTMYGTAAHQFQAMLDQSGSINESTTLKNRLDADDAAKSGAGERMQALEKTLETQEILHGKSFEDEVNYWQRYLNAFAVGSDQWIEVNKKYNDAAVAMQESYHIEPPDYSKEISKDSGKDTLLFLQNLNHTGQAWERYNAALLQGADIHEKLQASIDKTSDKILEEFGAINKQQMALREATAQLASYKQQADSVRTEMGLVGKDNSLTDVQRSTQLQQLQNKLAELTGQATLQQAQVDALKASLDLRVSMGQMFNLWVEKTQDTKVQITSLWDQFSTSMNDSMAKAITGAKVSWAAAFRGLAESATKMALSRVEGEILPHIPGIGGLMKSATSAAKHIVSTMNVQAAMVNFAGGGTAGPMGAGSYAPWAGAPGGSSWLSSIPLIGPMFSGAGAGAGITADDLSNSAGLWGGGMAFGGPVLAGMSYSVGEMGTETFIPHTNGSIIPNHALGGDGAYYHIDARGASAAEVDQRVQRSLNAVHGSAVKSSLAVAAEQRRRRARRS